MHVYDKHPLIFTGDYPMLAGNLASIGVGAIISVVSSYIVTTAFLGALHFADIKITVA